jgi:hypothetical protein
VCDQLCDPGRPHTGRDRVVRTVRAVPLNCNGTDDQHAIDVGSPSQNSARYVLPPVRPGCRARCVPDEADRTGGDLGRILTRPEKPRDKQAAQPGKAQPLPGCRSQCLFKPAVVTTSGTNSRQSRTRQRLAPAPSLRSADDGVAGGVTARSPVLVGRSVFRTASIPTVWCRRVRPAVLDEKGRALCGLHGGACSSGPAEFGSHLPEPGLRGIWRAERGHGRRPSPTAIRRSLRA